LRRADLVLLALAGCMRIDPDPELPDVVLAWSSDDCRENIGDVVLALGATELRVPCAQAKATFEDVPRERHRIDARLLDRDGAIFTADRTEVDLRDGLDETGSIYFGTFDNAQVAWAFEPGVSCESLAATIVVIEVSLDGEPAVGFGAPCELGARTFSAPPGEVAVRAMALVGETPVATSPSVDAIISDDEFTPLGTLLLAR
jgi:hypothetical protein